MRHLNPSRYSRLASFLCAGCGPHLEKEKHVNNTPPRIDVKPKLFAIIISLLAGIILGCCATLFLQTYNPKDANDSPGPSIVFSRIQSQNELVAASQDYCIVDKATDTARLFDLFDLPWTENSFWYRYEGTIKVGVNLATADFSESNEVITVTLDQPYIISNTPNMEASGVLEENNNLFNAIDVSDVDQFQRPCIEASEQAAYNDDLLETARSNAETNLEGMFRCALGDGYTVNFSWR